MLRTLPAPPVWRAYVALTKPRIMSLVVFTGVAAYLVTARAGFDWLTLLGLVSAGALAAGAASAYNSYLDRDLDAKMQRTRGRPVPAGVIRPDQALRFGILLTVLAAVLGVLTLNALALTFVLLGIAVYVGIYTMWLKRRSIWNIVIGGGAGSCAALAGGAAASGRVDLAAGLIGALVFVWTPSHFWSLAVRARDDYVRASVPMLPAVVGANAATRWIVGNTLLLVPLSLIFPLVGDFGVFYLAVAGLANGFLLYSNLRLLREPSPSNAWFAFKISSPYLALLFAAMLLEALPIFP